MLTEPARTSLARRLKGAAILAGLYSFAMPVEWNLDRLDLWNLVVSAAIYLVPGLTVLYGLLGRRSWARHATLVVSGGWLVLAAANIVIATWWFAGHPNGDEGLQLWMLVFQPMLLQVVPAVVLLVLLRPRAMRELLSPRHPTRS